MQSSSEGGETSLTQPQLQKRGNPWKRMRNCRKARNPGEPGDPPIGIADGQESAGRPGRSPSAQPEDAVPGDARGGVKGGAGGVLVSGTPGAEQPETLKEMRGGETRISIAGYNRKMRFSRMLGDTSSARQAEQGWGHSARRSTDR